MKHKYQTKKANKIYVAFLLLLSLSFSGYAQANLITNPSAEDDITGWTIVEGDNWFADNESGTGSSNTDYHTYPKDGSYFFAPGAGERAEMNQTIDVSAYATEIDSQEYYFLFTGYIDGYNGNDASQIKIEYYDQENGTLLSAFDSGETIATSFGWENVSDLRLAPSGTCFVKINLISTRYNGTNNDGYYDDLSLTLVRPFVTTWKTTTANESIFIPLHGNYTYDYTINWGDGTVEDYKAEGTRTHAYTTAGTYTIAITGNYPAINLLNGSASNLQTIEQWGDNVWENFLYSFYNCNNLTLNATDSPDLSNVTVMSSMFYGATSFNSDISGWDTSNVTTMQGMFSGATSFNSDISGWDTSSVTTMRSMFYNNSAFNQDISDWDISKVADLRFMFNQATSFDQDLSKWDYTSVTNMKSMFGSSGITSTTYDSMLIGWNNNTTFTTSAIDIGTVQTTYCEGATARASLVAKGWTIEDEGFLDCGITWTGATDTNWDDSTNWSKEEISNSSHTVTIPANLTNYPTATTEVSFNTMTMEAGTTFIPEATVTGTVTYNKSIPDTNWHLIASPVVGATIEDYTSTYPLATGSGDNIGLSTYSNDGSDWSYYTDASTGTLTTGIGYSTKLTESATVSFTGSLNYSDVSVAVSRGANNYFLLGNPFTTNINSATFVSGNEDLADSNAIASATIWVWNEDKYETYNNAKTIDIAPTESFFVELNDNDSASSVLLSADIRAHQANEASKQEATPYFELFIENETSKQSTEVFYIADATTGYDNGYDSKMFGGATYDFAVFTELVSDNEGEKLAIQTLPDNNTSVIPVGIIAKAGEEITLSVEEVNLPEDSTVYLEDTLTGEFTNLSETTYKTTIEEASNGVGQFYIHTSAKSLSTEDIATAITNISVYKSSNQEVTITGLNADASVSVYSLLGKEVVNTTITSNGVSTVSLPSLSAGVYIVKVNSEFGEVTKKITLN